MTPNRKKYRKQLEAALMKHTSSELLDMIRYWHSVIREYYGLMIKNASKFGLDRKIPTIKVERVDILVNILMDREIVRAWLKSLPSKIAEVVIHLAWFGPSRLDVLEKKVATVIAHEIDERYSTQLKLLDDFSFLGFRHAWEYPYQKEKSYVFLPLCYQYAVIANTDPPPSWHLKPVSAPIPAEYSCCFEASAPTEVLLAHEFISKGLMSIRKDGKPSARGLVDLRKVTQMEEFYPQEKGELKNLRASLVASFLGKISANDLSMETPHKALKILFEQWLQSSYTITENLLPHLKIYDKYYNKSSNINIKYRLRDILLEMTSGRYYTIENILDYILLHRYALEEIPYQELIYSFCDSSLFGEEVKDTANVTAWNVHYVVTEPLIKAFLFLSASIGLVELRYSLPENPLFRRVNRPGLTPFDGLKGVSLTPLGAYVIGASKKYKAKNKDRTGAKIFLDSQRLLLTLTGNDPIKELTLEKCMEKIGHGRYLLTFDSLFRECTTQKDIKAKKDMFQRFAGGKLPPVWKDFFARAKRRLRPFEREEEMMVFRMADDPELMEIIASDPTIAGLVFKVQGRRIAVKNKDTKKLKNRLRKYGYLMR